LAEYFIDGEDLIMYESIEDAIDKADYYLKHEDGLQKLAYSSRGKLELSFNYFDRAKTLLSIV